MRIGFYMGKRGKGARRGYVIREYLDLSMQIKKVDKGPMGWHDWAVARQAGGLARTENFRIFAGRV